MGNDWKNTEGQSEGMMGPESAAALVLMLPLAQYADELGCSAAAVALQMLLRQADLHWKQQSLWRPQAGLGVPCHLQHLMESVVLR